MSAIFRSRGILFLTGLHIIIQGIHAYAHASVPVATTWWQNIYIASIITALPVVSCIAYYRKSKPQYALIFSIAMLGALAFGVLFHFIIESPDLVARVSGKDATVFLCSAIGLVIIEALSVVLGVILFCRHSD